MIQGFKNVCRAGHRVHIQLQLRCSSTSTPSNKEEWRNRRNIIFDNEALKLKDQIGRIEKVTVTFQPLDKNESPLKLSMNKYLSTPDDCARHISEFVQKTAALAMVDNKPWDMHRPFTDDCNIEIISMQRPDILPAVNSAFWRTCSLILGATIDSAFKDDIELYMHSFPPPNIKSGSFVHDVVLNLPDWKPSKSEMCALSAQFVKLTNAALPVERLEISEKLALDMFRENPFKSKQIPDIAKSNEGNITLYRIGDYIDISKGPMVSNTSIVGRATIASVHKVDSAETDMMHRFQGIAIPRNTYLNHFAFGLLEERARKLNQSMWMPQKQTVGQVTEEPSHEEPSHEEQSSEEEGPVAVKN